MRLPHTKSKSSKSLKDIKYKLLLDEGLSLATAYPTLNDRHHLKHIAHDLSKSGISDKDLYKIAGELKMLPVVFNTKDFKPLIKRGRPSVIALSTNMTNREADLKICKALKELSRAQLTGHLILISKSGLIIRLRD